VNDPDFNRRVAEAVEATRFEDRAQEIVNDGSRIAGFADSVRTLGAVGLDSKAAIQDVLAAASSARPAQILVELGKDLDRAAAIANMDSVGRIRELVKIDSAISSPAAPPSPAPAPKAVNWRSDAASDEEFSRGFSEMMIRRRNLR
jgi:hypothetical protein